MSPRAIEAELTPERLATAAEIRRFWTNAASQARLEAFGTPIGLLRGQLNAAQYSAGRHWDRLSARFERAIDAPAAPRPVRLDNCGGRSTGNDALRAVDKAIVERFLDARDVLRAMGRDVERAVRKRCEGAGRFPVGSEKLLNLRQGLCELGRKWRL